MIPVKFREKLSSNEIQGSPCPRANRSSPSEEALTVVLLAHIAQPVSIPRRCTIVTFGRHSKDSRTVGRRMGPHALRRRLQLLGSASLALSICGITLSALAQSTELVSTRAVPTYFSDSENWAKAKAQAGGLRYVVMNPDSGPGAAIDPGWVSRLVDIGIEPKVLGYVATTYAARPLVDVVADIEKYRQWYGVTSIFLDETPWGCSQVAYYQSLATTVHANGGILVMNPGGLPLNCMVDIPDIVVSFENNMQAYLSSTAPNPTGYQPQKFWHLIYGAPVGRHREIEELARQRGAGFIYVTSDDLPNPWDGIETFPALPITAPTVVPLDRKSVV